MPTLDEQHTAPPPAPAWTGDHVRARLVEAYSVERRLPKEHLIKRVRSSWPATPLHTFTEMLHWTDTRERVWHNWERATGAHAWEVSRMEQAMSWLAYLPSGERNCLHAWVFASVYGVKVSNILRHKRWTKTTFYRQCDKAAARIAERLNRESVALR